MGGLRVRLSGRFPPLNHSPLAMLPLRPPHEQTLTTASTQVRNDGKRAGMGWGGVGWGWGPNGGVGGSGVRYGPTDMGRAGFQAFFRTHACGPVCRVLGLPPRRPDSLPLPLPLPPP